MKVIKEHEYQQKEPFRRFRKGGITVLPREIHIQPGKNQVKFPLDNIWTSSFGPAYTYASKERGELNVSVTANEDNEHSWGSSGVQLWIVPRYESLTLLGEATVRVDYMWGTEAVGFTSAKTIGSLNWLIREYNILGQLIETNTQDHRAIMMYGESSGFHDKDRGSKTFRWSIPFSMSGGARYSMWFWNSVINDAESNFLGWSMSFGHFATTIENIIIEAKLG